MTRNLPIYLVEVAIEGINKDADPMARQEFYLELEMRPHILGKNLVWDSGENTLGVGIHIQGLTEDSAAKQVAEELFEVANAVLSSVEGLKVKVLTARRLGR